tara:strand:+ start:240 stop:584 length:345 start_codon:yes stop_codon:yes gene_type:complete
MGAAIKAIAMKRAAERLNKKMSTLGDVKDGNFKKLAEDRLDKRLRRAEAIKEDTEKLAKDPAEFMRERTEGLLNPRTAIKQQLLKEGFPEDAIDNILGKMFVAREQEENRGILG